MSRPAPRREPVIKLPLLDPRCPPEQRPRWVSAPTVSSHKRCLWIFADPRLHGVPKTRPPAPSQWQSLLRPHKNLAMPLGPMTAINYFPASWEHRLLDERVGTPVSDEDLTWANVVLLSGLYVEVPRANEIAVRSRQLGLISVIGGPGVILNPDLAVHFDIVHIGDLGDHTYDLVQWLDANNHPPPWQLRFQTQDVIPMDLQPLPAFDKIDPRHYTSAMVQFQKGCPFLCEFCDIIEIYGRVPQSKSPQRFLREFDLLYESGWRGRVNCVADNFHANHKLAREMLCAIATWQRRRGYPFRLETAATLDVADKEDMLRLYHDAGFAFLGIGIETPDEDTLRGIHKKQNVRIPVIEAVRKINAHGIEVAASLVLGFDTDTPESGTAQVAFVEMANIVVVGLSMLTALKGTQLYRRVEQEGRLLPEWPYMEYRLGQDTVQEMFDETVRGLYEPESMLRRLRYQVEHVRPRQRPARDAGLGSLWQDLGAAVAQRLGRSSTMTVDGRGRRVPGATPPFQLPALLAGGLLAMWKLGVKWPRRAHYWRFLLACIWHRDVDGALQRSAALVQLAEVVAEARRARQDSAVVARAAKQILVHS